MLHHVGEATSATQRMVDAGFARARLQLKVWELRAAPQTRERIERTKRDVDDGSARMMLTDQRDAKELAAKRRS
jgi:hypothetical protein